MTNRRIDRLRERVAEIGKRRQEYDDFFPGFAKRLVTELGQFLGDEGTVALSTDKDDFSFDVQYRSDGLRIVYGRYQIPMMVRLDNLGDDGNLTHRFFLYCSKHGSRISAAIHDQAPFDTQELNLEPLCEHIYQYLQESFSNEQWFSDNRKNYQGSGIGFLLDR